MADQPRVAVVTGASSALGAALLPLLSGYWILGIGRVRPAASLAQAWACVDFRQPWERWRGTVEAALRDRGVQAIHGLVHMAGTVFSDHLEATTPNEWDHTLAVNLSAAFGLAQVLSPLLADGASVVWVSSVDARMAAAAGPAAAYGASKAGLIGLAKHLAVEWGNRGIRVNVVMPGALVTGSGPTDGEVSAAVARATALGRLGEPHEVATVIRFLLGPDASYITGAVVAVDGGMNLRY